MHRRDTQSSQSRVRAWRVQGLEYRGSRRLHREIAAGSNAWRSRARRARQPQRPAAALPASTVLGGLSLILLSCGIGLRRWSFRTLGRSFTFNVMTSPDQPVITAGPYRVLRHPSPTGLLQALLGVGLAFDNWLGLAGLMVFACIGLLNRIRVEEAALPTLGERYLCFARTRKRLIPYVW